MTMFCHPVDRKPHDDDRGGGEDAAEAERVAGRHAAGRQGPSLGALHHRVDVAVVPHIDRPGGTGADRDAQHGDRREEGMQMSWREVKTDEAGEDDERHDTRLEQRDVVVDAGIACKRGTAGEIGAEKIDGRGLCQG